MGSRSFVAMSQRATVDGWTCQCCGQSQWADGQWWPRHCGGHVTVGSMTVVVKLLYGTCHSGEKVSGGHATVRSCHSVQQVCGGHVTVRSFHSVQQVSGGHVTASNRPLVAMSLWGLCHSGQQVSCGHVTIGAMSQWAAGQWWPCHCEFMSQWGAGQWWPCHCGGHVTVGCRSVVAMPL